VSNVERLAYIHRNDPAKLAQIYSEYSAQPKKESAKVETPVATSWLEIAVSQKLSEIQQLKVEAADRERLRIRGELQVREANLRTSLGSFLRDAPVRVQNGKGYFTFRGKEYSIWLEAGDTWLACGDEPGKKLNSQLAGGISDKIIYTLAQREDF
jgi:hypothetical protein